MTLELPWLFLGARLGIDATSGTFLGFTLVLWALAAVFAFDYVKARRRSFAAFFAATFAGNLGLVLSQDAVTFYLCFALMTFAAYGLVVHERTPQALRAGRVYIGLAVIGEAFLLAGLILLASDGAARDSVIALLLAGFGVKAGMLGLHLWLPLAHPVAPTPASAVLSGAMIKAGLLGWLQFLPLGEAAYPAWGAGLFALGLAAAFYGALVGVLQDDPKAVLAYSSISQMGLMTVAVGAALASPAAAPAAIAAAAFYALHHALAKGALFLGVGIGPAGRPLLLAALVLPAAALAGMPFTSGVAAKHGLKAVLHDWPLLAPLLSLAAAGTTLLMARYLFLMRRQPRGAPGGAALISWLLCVAASAGALFLAPLPAASWADLWPALLGIALALAAMRLPARARTLRIPPGDVVVPLAALASRARRALRRAGDRTGHMARAALDRIVAAWTRIAAQFAALSADGEAWMRFAGSASLLAVCAVLFLAAVA